MAIDNDARGLAGSAHTKTFIGGTSFAILGDSVTQLNSVTTPPVSGSTTQIATWNTGYFAWAKALLGQQITFDLANNFGLGGDTLYPGTDSNGTHPGIISRVPNVIASGVGNCVVLGGHNDVTTSNTSYTNIIYRLTDIVTQLRKANIRVFLGTLVPVSGMNSTQYSKLLGVNEFIRQYCLKTPGVHLVDWWPYINDYTSTNPQQKANFARYNDTLHPGVKSAYMMGYALSQSIKGALGDISQTFVIGSQGDVYNATNGPSCALSQNPAMSGTSGAVITAGGATNCTISGQAATNFTVQKYGGSSTCTVTASLENPRTDLNGFCNGQRQVVSFSATQSGNQAEIIQINSSTVTVASGSYAAGDSLFAECTVELSNPINMYGVWLLISENHTVAYQTSLDLANDGTSGNQQNALMENVARTYKYTLRTPIMTTNSNSQSVYAQVNIVFNPQASSSGASGTVKIGDLAIRKPA